MTIQSALAKGGKWLSVTLVSLWISSFIANATGYMTMCDFTSLHVVRLPDTVVSIAPDRQTSFWRTAICRATGRPGTLARENEVWLASRNARANPLAPAPVSLHRRDIVGGRTEQVVFEDAVLAPGGMFDDPVPLHLLVDDERGHVWVVLQLPNGGPVILRRVGGARRELAPVVNMKLHDAALGSDGTVAVLLQRDNMTEARHFAQDGALRRSVQLPPAMREIAVAHDGALWIGGETSETDPRALIVRIDGKTGQRRQIDLSGMSNIIAISEDRDDGIWIVGRSLSEKHRRPPVVMRLDARLQATVTKILEAHDDFEDMRFIAATRNGGAWLSGERTRRPSGTWIVRLLRLSANGELEREHAFMSQSSSVTARRLHATVDGDAVLMVACATGEGDEAATLMIHVPEAQASGETALNCV